MLRKFISYSFGSIGSAIFRFVSIAVLTRIMSPQEFGTGMMYITFITLFFFLCDLGLDQGYVRYFYERKTDRERIKLLYQILTYISLMFCMISLFLIIFRNGVMELFFGISSSVLLIYMIIGGGVFIINKFVQLTIRMQQKAILYSFGLILTSGSNFIFILLLYKIYKMASFDLIIISQIASLVVSTCILIILDIKHWNYGRASHFIKTFPSSFQVLKYSVPFTFSLIMTWGVQSLDRVILLHFSGAIEVGIYAAAFSLASPLILFQTIFTTMWAPKMNEMLIKNYNRSLSYFSKVYKFMLWTMTFLFIIVVLLKSLIIMLLGVEFSKAVGVFAWMLFVPFFYLLSEITVAGIIYKKKSLAHVYISFSTLAVNIIACYMLIPNYGAEGAAMALALSYFVFFMLRTVFSGVYLKINYSIFQTLIIALGLLCIVLFS